MNRKAQIFESALTLAVFLISIFALTSFLLHNKAVNTSLGEFYSALSSYNRQDDISLYAKEAGKVSLHEAYAETLKRVGDNCEKYDIIPIWDTDCLMKNDQFQEEFKNNFNSSIIRILGDKGIAADSISIDREIIAVSIPFMSQTSLRGISQINANYTADLSFSFNMSDYNVDLDFWKISSHVMGQWNVCSKKSDETIKQCINSLDFKDWAFSKVNSDFVSKLTSKRNYYINGKMQPIEIKFKLEK